MSTDCRATSAAAQLRAEVTACLNDGGGRVEIPAPLHVSDSNSFTLLMRALRPPVRAASKLGFQAIIGPDSITLVPRDSEDLQ